MTIDAYNLAGESVRLDADGLLARVVQHETDHINGKLFIDRLSTTGKLEVRHTVREFEIQFESQREHGEVPSEAEIKAGWKSWKNCEPNHRRNSEGGGRKNHDYLPPSACRLPPCRHGHRSLRGPHVSSAAAIDDSILALVTRPDRPVHSREKPLANPMRAVAEGVGLEVFEPESINSPEAHAWLKAKSADLFVVCDYGQILSRETSRCRAWGHQLHASLLPISRSRAD